MLNTPRDSITSVVVQMYKMGTGDCFVLKFKKRDDVVFKMLIDCGAIRGTYKHLRGFVEKIQEEVDGKIDVLIITHEHEDHVRGFKAAEEIFKEQFEIGEIWLGWPDDAQNPVAQQLKEEHGKRKRALLAAAEKLGLHIPADFDPEGEEEGDEDETDDDGGRFFDQALRGFAQLHLSGGDFVDHLKGITVIKAVAEEKGIKIRYFQPGEIRENIAELSGIRFYFLGPPQDMAAIAKETGAEGEAYQHNKTLDTSDFFMTPLVDEADETVIPFDAHFEIEINRADHLDEAQQALCQKEPWQRYLPESQAWCCYGFDEQAWRRIDNDWLTSVAGLALRLNAHINNLSLVMAIEHVDSGKILLFPGDAEFGSWNSWHHIDWSALNPDLTTPKLLNNVVFYKVAHHLSHNGTARSIGLDMMTHPDLVAMATLDYSSISSGWKTTMPNRLLLKDLLDRTKGRLIILNESGLPFGLEEDELLSDKIAEFRNSKLTSAERAAFLQNLNDDHDDKAFFTEYEVKI